MGSGPGALAPSRNDGGYSVLLRLPAREPQIWDALSRRPRDLVRRVHDHKSKAVSGFTAQQNVDRLVWFETYEDAATAIFREKQLKKWRRDWKIRLIEEANSEWQDLYGIISQ